LGGKRIVVVSAMSQVLHCLRSTTFVALTNCARKALWLVLVDDFSAWRELERVMGMEPT